MAVDVAIHAPGREGDQRNHHAHLLTTTRRIGPEGLGEKTRELDQKTSGEVERWRGRWAEMQNVALEGVLSRNRRKFRQPINVACPAPGRWGRPNSRVTSRHFDHGNASRTSRPDCSGLDEAD